MEEMGEEAPSSPFWLQSTTATVRHRHRRRNTSSFFLNTGVLVGILLAAAIVFLLIVIPSILSLARQIFHPSSLTTSWNSLNILLVLFAIICGFIGRKGDDGLTTPVTSPTRREQVEYDNIEGRGLRRRSLTRHSSSYPDLRQEESIWERENQQWRFSDDMNLNNQRFEDSHISYTTRSQPRNHDLDVIDKAIQVDTCVTTSPEVEPETPVSRSTVSLPDQSPPAAIDQEVESEFVKVEVESPASLSEVPPPEQPPSPSPPPSPATFLLPPPSPTTYFWPPSSPPPPPPPPPPRPRRRAQPPAKSSKQQIKEIYETMGHLPPPSPSPPPPPPPPPPRRGSGHSDVKKERSGKKRGGATKEFLVSFYHQTKRKRKQKRRSYENLDEFMEATPSKVSVSIHRSKSTPEFPPSSLPSPPRSPPPSVFQNLFSSSKTKKKVQSSSSRPPKEKRKVTSGNTSESSLNPKGGLESKNSRSSGGYSDGESSARARPGVMCPSPDVNMKADDFIAKFREKLNFEKMDSIKQKQESGESRDQLV